MRYALISDVHANLPALEAVLEDSHARAVDAVVHLGDLVGYGPWPDEVVELLRERGIHGVAGNHDSTVVTDQDHWGCPPEDATGAAQAAEAHAWTRRRVSAKTRAALAALPFRIDLRPYGGHDPRGGRLVLVHGTPALNTRRWAEERSDAFCLRMAGAAGARAGDMLAFGHTHRPWRRVVEGIRLVNCGSVGWPRDGDPRASYALVEFAPDGRVDSEIVRVTYDVDRAAAALRASALPDAFAAALERGGASTITEAG